MKNTLIFGLLIFLTAQLQGQQIAILNYRGGGDWYANPTSLASLIAGCNTEVGRRMDLQGVTVAAGSRDRVECPVLRMPGHGNVHFDAQEANSLLQDVVPGGCLDVDANYGMVDYFKKELAEIL